MGQYNSANPRRGAKRGLTGYGIGDIYAMPYTVSMVPADAPQIIAEFNALLNDQDPAVGNDAAQLGADLKAMAKHTNSTPTTGTPPYWRVYPMGGTCAACYAYESNNGTRIFILGFCLTANSTNFQPTAANRLSSVP